MVNNKDFVLFIATVSALPKVPI